MADTATGAEAGKKFLEDNKSKDGIITLASGLQYKVLKQGNGMDHPKVGTSCECHYAGTLIDGTEFDSSYKRGQPSTFAPNQVIKGWTEAMQLMVEGDKWEMYIPMELAYGPNGKPPKIPPAAALIFQMEIVKIKGETVPKQIEFPEWTPEQLALWTDADEAQCQKWRDTKIQSWEEGKMRDIHATRELFEAWLDKQCLSSKNKSLYKRTRPKKSEPAGPPQLTKVTARAMLTKALDTFRQPANKELLQGIVKDCEAADPSEGGNMMKMMKLMPAVGSMMSGTLTEYGFGPNDLMAVTMQIQAFGPEDPSIAADTAKLMKAVQGDFADIFDE